MNIQSNLENSGINRAAEISAPSPVPNSLPISETFVERRKGTQQRKSPGLERRQFSDGYHNLTPAAAELGLAIDQYKLANSRRFISYEEMLNVIKSLGYSKQVPNSAANSDY